MPRLISLAAAATILAGALTQAAPLQAQPADITLDAAARADVIDGALRALNEGDVFPETAEKMAQAIRARQQRKEYDAITSGRQFALTLTQHLRDVSHDLHLGVNFIPPGTQEPIGPPPPGSERTMEERQRIMAGRRNFGFVRVERLAGNIGYVDLRAFLPPQMSGETAAAAMTFLASTNAVIFDMRENGGGDPAMVAFLTSYLFAPRVVHLNDFYARPSNVTRQSWTLPYVPGRRLTDVEAYILTSPRTFSGAEEFTYNLKHLKRATVVGETTGGAAHTVAGRPINSRFMIAVPSGRPINPVTKTNWEGVGVEPDVNVPAARALDTAYLMALEKQQQALPADAPWLKHEVTTTIARLRGELDALATPAASSSSVRLRYRVHGRRVLASLFQAQPDAPARREPTDVVVDLSPWEGQTVRLRFAVADNRGPLRAAVDNIRFERLPQ